MSKDQVHIVSDGTARGTKVLDADGKPLPCVMKVEIQPIVPNGMVTAVVTLSDVALDIANVEAGAVTEGEGTD